MISKTCFIPSPLATVAMVTDATSASPPPGDIDGCEGEDMNNNLVEVYADRLCAVTHAFALCCATLQKNSGKYDTCAYHIYYRHIYICGCMYEHNLCTCVCPQSFLTCM